MTKVIKIFENSPGNRRPCEPGTALNASFRQESIEVEGKPSLGAFSFNPSPPCGNAGYNGYKSEEIKGQFLSFDQKSEKNSILLVHTLAQLDTSPPDVASGSIKKDPPKEKKSLQKRARSKYITNNISIKLAALKSSLNKSYWNSYHCCETLEQKDQVLKGKYCNNRWCLTCNRIRTAKLINGYSKVLKDLPDKRFVTLTVPNVPASKLKETLEDMTKTFQDIRQTFIKRQIRLGGDNKRLVGIRKTEVTFNPDALTFHPHFHTLVSGTAVSQTLINEWLKRYPLAVSIAQDDRSADDDSVMELFKYFTKMVTKERFCIDSLDVIFKAMRNKRVFQPMGIKKNVSEDVDGIQSIIYNDLIPAEEYWSWIEGANDWIAGSTGETLTGYMPSEEVEKLLITC